MQAVHINLCLKGESDMPWYWDKTDQAYQAELPRRKLFHRNMATSKTLNQKWYILGPFLNYKGIDKTNNLTIYLKRPQTNETTMKQQWTHYPGRVKNIISFVMCSKVLQHFKLATPMKMNMEPETWTMEEEIHVGKPHFQVPCSFQGVYFQRKIPTDHRKTPQISQSPNMKGFPSFQQVRKFRGFGVCSDNCVYFKGFFCKSKTTEGVLTQKNSQLHA